MKFRSWLCLLVAATPAGALDLSPQFGQRELEGFQIPILRFGDGGRKVSYRPPEKWRVSGTTAELNLIPPKRADCRAIFSVRPLASDAGEELKKWARECLPGNAVEVESLGEKESPFMLGKLPSHEFIFAYQQNGIRFVRSVAIVDLSEKERLSVAVVARRDDFEAVHAEIIASMFSWEWED